MKEVNELLDKLGKLEEAPLIWINKKVYDNQEKIQRLNKENQELKELYRRTCEHLFNIGNEELARYFQAQINECPVFTTQGSDKE